MILKKKMSHLPNLANQKSQKKEAQQKFHTIIVMMKKKVK